MTNNIMHVEHYLNIYVVHTSTSSKILCLTVVHRTGILKREKSCPCTVHALIGELYYVSLNIHCTILPICEISKTRQYEPMSLKCVSFQHTNNCSAAKTKSITITQIVRCEHE